MDKKNEKFTHIHPVIVIAVITLLTLIAYLLGSWATYPTERHRATAQEQKEFLERNGLFSGAKEYEDLKNTPEAKYSSTVSGVSASAQYLLYVLILVSVYIFMRKRRKRAIMITTVTSVSGSLLGTAIIIAFSNNLSNLTTGFSQIIISVLFTILVFTMVTFFIVCGIHFLFNKFQKNKSQASKSVDQEGGGAFVVDRIIGVKKFSKAQLAKPKSVFTILFIFSGAIAIGASTLPVLGVSVTCTQEEYVRLRGDCALASPSTTSTTDSSVAEKTDDLKKSFVDSTVSIRPLNADRNEGNSGITELTYTVKRSGDLSSPASIDWYVQTGTETVQTAGRVNFTKNEAAATIAVKVRGNTSPEPDKGVTVCINASQGVGVEQKASCAGGVVRNDDKMSPCGNSASLAVQSACTVAIVNKNINTAVTTTIKIAGGTISTIVDQAITLMRPVLSQKKMVTLGDSYEVGVPSGCVALGVCVNEVSSILSKGTLREILNLVLGKNTCGRFDYTSTKLTLDSLNKQKGQSWTAQNVSCAGAQTSQILSGWSWFLDKKQVTSQLSALDSKDVGLVIISAGGNDVVFTNEGEKKLPECAKEIMCTSESDIITNTFKDINKLFNKTTNQGSLIGLYESIRGKTTAPVFVKGYPIYAGPQEYITVKTTINTPQCKSLEKQRKTLPKSCSVEYRKPVAEAPTCKNFTNQERLLANEAFNKLNNAIRDAVEYINLRYRNNQFLYVDPFAPGRYDFTNDHLCSSSRTKPISAPGEWAPIEAHPNVNGVQRRSQQTMESYQKYESKNNIFKILAQ